MLHTALQNLITGWVYLVPGFVFAILTTLCAIAKL